MVRKMCRSAVWSIATLAVLVSAAGDAAAQAPGAPPPPPPAVARQATPSFPRWGIGAHLGGLGIVSARDRDDDADNETEMGLAGVQLRFRLHRRWELELDLSGMDGELPGPGDTRRTTGALVLGGMFHINPDSRWLCSVLLGVGVARDRIWYEKGDDHVTVADFVEGLGRVGFGVERRFHRWGIGAQLYAIGMARDEEELDGPAYIGRDGPVPEESTGGLFQLAANYYF